MRWVIGVVLYWCEGAKARSWSPTPLVAFTNMEAVSLLVFRQWLLQCAGAAPEDLSYDLRIHPDVDLDRARSYWASIFRVDAHAIKTYLKPGNASTRRRHVGQGYYGTIRLRVRRSTQLLHWIEGCVQGIVHYCGVG